MTRRTSTDLIVVHCSATRPQQDVDANTIREWHMAKGWQDIGYHFVIKRNGLIELGRPLEDVGAHAAGFNSRSVGICLAGGLDHEGNPLTQHPAGFTPPQHDSLALLLKTLRSIYPSATILGHRDLSPDSNHNGKIEPHEWLKTCPGFDAKTLYGSL